MTALKLTVGVSLVVVAINVGHGHDHRLGAGARPLLRADVRQLADRPALRPAHHRRRRHPAGDLRARQPGGREPRLHPRRGLRGAAAGDAALRGALACSRCCWSSTARWRRRPPRWAPPRRTIFRRDHPAQPDRPPSSAAPAWPSPGRSGEFGSLVLIAGTLDTKVSSLYIVELIEGDRAGLRGRGLGDPAGHLARSRCCCCPASSAGGPAMRVDRAQAGRRSRGPRGGSGRSRSPTSW